ncbi:MAG: hypothetical protein IK044_05255 [Methanobrevibacter sp.]|nr:hypothetical protein [Methanobrevibacter sp.]
MAKKEEMDVDKELKRMSKSIDIQIIKSENSFDNLLNKLDDDINKAVSSKVKMFDESKDLTSKHVTTSYTDDALERYKRKLDKI